MSSYYDKDGRPIGLREWVKLADNSDYKRVALTKLPGGGEVSTVWLGLDHNFSMAGPPLIFEAMLFHGEEGSDCERCSTLEEAKRMHEAMVAKWSQK